MTAFITGASRGIGKAIALKLAKEGVNIIIAAKSVEENPKLGGTIFSAAKEIEDAGGKAFPVQCDIRFEDQIQTSIDKAVAQFGGIDIVINNASAISLTNTEDTESKRFDLMHVGMTAASVERLRPVYAAIARRAPDFVLHCGDITDTGLPGEYEWYWQTVPAALRGRIRHDEHLLRWCTGAESTGGTCGFAKIATVRTDMAARRGLPDAP